MNDSRKLLDDYARRGSEAAFRELVGGYVGLVHSTALRLVNGDSHLAEDVTQTVFVDLARKARSLSSEVLIGGWLHRHTCYVAATMMRGDRRRQNREKLAVEMNATEDHSAANLAKVAPILDEAINELNAEDRAAILLRFFEQLEFRAVGEVLGSNEAAARMRVNRALEKLHTLLKERGVALSLAGLGTALAAEAVTAAPVGLAASAATAALAGAAAGGTTLALVKIMSMTKAKIAVAGLVALVAVAAPVAQYQTIQGLRRENEDLKRQVAQIAPLQEQAARASQEAASASNAAATQAQVLELVKLRGEVRVLREQTNDLAKTHQQIQTLTSQMAKLQSERLRFDAANPSGTFPTQEEVAQVRINQCINNLRMLDGAKGQWALENHKQVTDIPTMDDIRPYMGRGPNGEIPVCPEGGTYILGTIVQKPTCSVAKHALP